MVAAQKKLYESSFYNGSKGLGLVE